MPVPPNTTGVAGVKAEIEARLRDAPRLKGVQGFLDAVVGGEATVTTTDGYLIPYWVLTFGTRSQVQNSHQGITSTRDDLRRMNFGVEVYAMSPGEVARLEDDVWDALVGFAPEGASEIKDTFAGGVTNPIDFKQNHYRDGRGLLFVTLTNTIPPTPEIG